MRLQWIKAKPVDLDAMNKLMRKSKGFWGYDRDFMDQFMRLFQIAEPQLETSQIQLLYGDAVLVGFYSLRVDADNGLELDHFFVDPDCMGAGIGKIMWSHMIATTRSLGQEELTLWSDPNADGFYEKMGCVKIGEKKSPMMPNRHPAIYKYVLSPLIFRKATESDLKRIVQLLQEDDLGATREHLTETLNPRYIKAFHLIDQDPQQYLMVVEQAKEIMATCHLTIMPSLTFTGSTRMQIEAVRVAASMRGQRIGEQMMQEAIAYGKSKDASIIQLTTNKKRPRAKQFYERLGFEASHEGMKLYL